MSCNSSTPIAITGMGCRFAGDATSPQKLWDLIRKGRSAWSKIPASRFNVGGVYHPNGERLGSVSIYTLKKFVKVKLLMYLYPVC